jgi:hypothetical protein
MRHDRRIKLYKDLKAPGTRRVLDALEQVMEEMTDFGDQELPQMPAGVLMKGRPEGGRMSQ